MDTVIRQRAAQKKSYPINHPGILSRTADIQA